MRIAYADPPYIGQAKVHYSHDPRCGEVDHLDLLRRLDSYDGWALSASSPSLFEIASLAVEAWGLDGIRERGVRIGSWVKPFCSYKPGVNPAYAWEPVVFRPARPLGRARDTVRDWVSANITLKKGLAGAKPEEVCFWLFEALGMTPEDDFEDLFPGTGVVAKAHDRWCRQGRLPLVGA